MSSVKAVYAKRFDFMLKDGRLQVFWQAKMIVANVVVGIVATFVLHRFIKTLNVFRGKHIQLANETFAPTWHELAIDEICCIY